MNYEEEKESLKKVHGKVFTIMAPMDDEGEKFNTLFLKKPNRSLHNIVGKLAQGNDPTKAIEAALKNMYVGGDSLDEVLADDDALMGCENSIVELMAKRQSVLKKN